MADRVETDIKLSKQELFERKINDLQLKIGETFYGIFGDGEQRAGILRGVAVKLKQADEYGSLFGRIMTEGEVDSDKVVAAGNKWTEKNPVIYKDQQANKEYELNSYIAEILRSSVLLREAVLKTGGQFKSSGMSEELRFSRKEKSSYDNSTQIVESRSSALDDLTEAYKIFDINQIARDIREEGEMSGDLEERLYVAVLLSSLKSDTVYPQDVKRQTIESFTAQSRLPVGYNYDAEAGVLSGGEVEYSAYLTERNLVKKRLSDGEKIKKYFTENQGFRSVEDTYYTTEDGGDKSRVVAVLDGKEKGQMFGVTDSELILVKRAGEWTPVVIERKIKNQQVTDLARAEDIINGSISFVKTETGNEIQIKPITTAEVLMGRRNINEEQVSKAVEIRSQELDAKLREVATWANPPIEILSKTRIEFVWKEGKRQPIKMVARTINGASSDLKKLINVEEHGPQGFFGEDGMFYTRLLKAQDQDKNRALNLHVVDLRGEGKEVVAKNYGAGRYYATNLSITNLVEDSSSKNIGEGHGLNWALVEKRWKDSKRKDRWVNMYVVSANDKGKDSSLDEQTKNVVNANSLPYAIGYEPGTDTPTIVDIKVEGEDSTIARLTKNVLLRLANIGSGSEIDAAVPIDVSKVDEIIDRKRRSSLRVITDGIDGVRMLPETLQPVPVSAGKGRAFLVLDKDGENTKKKSKTAEVKMVLMWERNGILRQVDIHGNVYEQRTDPVRTPLTYVETVALTRLKEVLE